MSLSRPPLKLAEFLPYRLSVISKLVSAAIADAYRAEFGLTIPQWRILAVLGEQDAGSSADVATATAMDKVAVSRALSGLVQRGLVEHDESPLDRRRRRLTLSEQGRDIYDRIAPRALAIEARLLEAFDPDQRARLVELLDVLERTAKAMGSAPTPAAKGVRHA